jgi:hypothetical protein
MSGMPLSISLIAIMAPIQHMIPSIPAARAILRLAIDTRPKTIAKGYNIIVNRIPIDPADTLADPAPVSTV